MINYDIDNDNYRLAVFVSEKKIRQKFFICRANSMTWNPHKLMGVPLQCSAILLRDKVSQPHTSLLISQFTGF